MLIEASQSGCRNCLHAYLPIDLYCGTYLNVDSLAIRGSINLPYSISRVRRCCTFVLSTRLALHPCSCSVKIALNPSKRNVQHRFPDYGMRTSKELERSLYTLQHVRRCTLPLHQGIVSIKSYASHSEFGECTRFVSA